MIECTGYENVSDERLKELLREREHQKEVSIREIPYMEKELKKRKEKQNIKPKHGDIVEFGNHGKRIVILIDGQYRAFDEQGYDANSGFPVDNLYNPNRFGSYYKVVGNVFEGD